MELLSVLGIILAVLTWYFKREDVPRLLARVRKPFQLPASLTEMESAGLIVRHRDLLVEAHVYRDLYWPVVPADSPNLIHVTFVRYLRPLCAAGLKCTLFVFDEYSAVLHNRPVGDAKRWAATFVEGLRKLGLPERAVTVVYQSDTTRISRRLGKVLPTIFRYFGEITIGDLTALAGSKPHYSPSTKAIRFVKPILNWSYLLTLPGQFGFTLSGADEQPVWEIYQRLANEMGLPNPVKLFIPKMNGLGGGSTHALDRTGNITLADDEATVRTKVRESLPYLSNGSALSYVLHHVVFGQGLSITIPGSPESRVTSSRELDVVLSRPAEVDAAVEAISMCMRQLFSGDLYRGVTVGEQSVG